MAQQSQVFVQLGSTPKEAQAMTVDADNQRYRITTATDGSPVWGVSMTYDDNPVRSADDGNGFVYIPGVSDRIKATPTSSNDQVSVPARSVTIGSKAKVSIPANATLSIPRPADGAAPFKQVAIVIDETTSAYTVVEGTDGSSFSDTVGAAGGLPFIPVDNILVDVVKYTSATAAPVKATEINIALREYNNSPFTFYEIDREMDDMGRYVGTLQGCMLKFATPQPAIHDGSAPRNVYIKYAIPLVSDDSIVAATSFTPPSQVTASSQTPRFNRNFLSTEQTSFNMGSVELTYGTRAGLDDAVIGQLLRLGPVWMQVFPGGVTDGWHWLITPTKFDSSAPTVASGSSESTVTLTGLSIAYALKQEDTSYLTGG